MKRKDDCAVSLLFFPAAQLASCVLVPVINQHQLPGEDVHFVADEQIFQVEAVIPGPLQEGAAVLHVMLEPNDVSDQRECSSSPRLGRALPATLLNTGYILLHFATNADCNFFYNFCISESTLVIT